MIKGEPPAYFPDNIFHPGHNLHEFLSCWFSKALWMMQEPLRLDFSQNRLYQGYRFLWLRIFHKPISIRIDISGSGSGLLTAKMTSGAGGYYPGRLEPNTSLGVFNRSVEMFLMHLSKADYWRMTTVEEEHGLDGAEWVMHPSPSDKEGSCLELKRAHGQDIGREAVPDPGHHR